MLVFFVLLVSLVSPSILGSMQPGVIILENKIKVPQDYPSIQEAISSASEGDTILVAPGTYYERLWIYGGKSITLKSEEGAEKTIIDGEKKGRVVTFFANQNSEKIILDGFTIINGETSSFATGIHTGYGGGILCAKSSNLIFENLIVTNNKADNGGGICCYDNSNPIVKNVIISNNIATQNGGGFYVDNSNPIIQGAAINGNAASNGGGIYYDSDCKLIINPSLQNIELANNTAVFNGGGICLYRKFYFIMENLKIINNSAGFNGNGIYIKYSKIITLNKIIIKNNFASTFNGGGLSVIKSDDVSLVDSSIADSRAHEGGGVFVDNSSKVELVNSNITNNRAHEGGGVFVKNSSEVALVNSFITDNIADNLGGGLFLKGEGELITLKKMTISNNFFSNSSNVYGSGIYGYSVQLNIKESIIWGNQVGSFPTYRCNKDGCKYSTEYIMQLDYNDEISTIVNSNTEEAFTGEGNISVTPLFVDSNNNNIIDRDYHLRSDSPCLEMGANFYNPIDVPLKVNIITEDIIKDTIWKKGRPYVLAGDNNIDVAAGITLNIEPGAHIYFKFNKQLWWMPRLVVLGKIKAEGTFREKIKIQAYPEKNYENEVYKIWIGGPYGAGLHLKHCDISNVETWVYYPKIEGGEEIKIDNCDIANTNYAIKIFKSKYYNSFKVFITNSKIHDNKSTGICFSSLGNDLERDLISDCEIFNNGYNGIYLYGKESKKVDIVNSFLYNNDLGSKNVPKGDLKVFYDVDIFLEKVNFGSKSAIMQIYYRQNPLNILNCSKNITSGEIKTIGCSTNFQIPEIDKE